MAKGRKRSTKKILDAFQIAQRAEEGGYSDNESKNGDFSVKEGVFDALHLLGKGSVPSDIEDEEIDSDEALGSDDDFDILNSKFSQTIRDKAKHKKQRARDRKRGKLAISLDESDSDDDGYASVDESQFVSLSEAWDMDDRDLKVSSRKNSNNGAEVVLDDLWESQSEEEEEDDEEEEGDEEDDGEDDEEDDEEEDGADSDSESDVFEGFDDASDASDLDLSNTLKSVQSKLPKAQKEKKRLLTEKRDENEFSLPTSGAKLSLDEMMGDVDQGEKLLIDREKKSLATPLPKNIQQRNDRRVAYDLAKHDVDKWKDTVKQNREAEVLHFPMNPTIQHNDTAVTFKSDNKPSTELEQKVHSLLSESALLDDTKEATFEDIETAKMSIDDMKKRTNELRLMRELMFREEKRAKRIKKIKSKQYHKIQKKERLRNQEMVEGSDESDLETHDMKRAQERMSLKHKTQLSWAKSMIKSGLSKDANNRAELEEMLRQGEKLRAKQLGHEDGERSDSGISDVENEYGDDSENEDDIKARGKLGKGVLAMDFMRNAEERSRAENKREIELLRQLEDDANSFDAENGLSVNISKNQGRRVYTPQAAASMKDVDEANEKIRQEIEDDNEKSLVKKLLEPKNDQKKHEIGKTEIPESEIVESVTVEEENPWLTPSDGPGQRKKKVAVVDQYSSKLSKAAQKIKKKNKGSSSSEDSVIDINKTLKIASDIHGSEDEQEHGEEDANNIQMFTQKDLIKEAFAGDDVVTEFEIEKKRVARAEDDQVEDLTLPGWGDWAGGNKKSKKRKIVRKIQGVVQQDKRKDKNLKNVIINEKVNKKNLKYQSSSVPFPYESKEQYERALRMPVGQEWTSRETHQRLTMPRVIAKQGSVIDPLKAPFK